MSGYTMTNKEFARYLRVHADEVVNNHRFADESLGPGFEYMPSDLNALCTLAYEAAKRLEATA